MERPPTRRLIVYAVPQPAVVPTAAAVPTSHPAPRHRRATSVSVLTAGAKQYLEIRSHTGRRAREDHDKPPLLGWMVNAGRAARTGARAVPEYELTTSGRGAQARGRAQRCGTAVVIGPDGTSYAPVRDQRPGPTPGISTGSGGAPRCSTTTRRPLRPIRTSRPRTSPDSWDYIPHQLDVLGIRVRRVLTVGACGLVRHADAVGILGDHQPGHARRSPP